MREVDPTQPYCVIPARFSSTRFPGKPLVPLLGKPMVLWVAEACEQAVGNQQVIIATEDRRIFESAATAGFQAAMTSRDALTGTDRVAEVAAEIGGQTVVNVQGDEPLVSPEDILKVARVHQENRDYVVNGYTHLSAEEDPHRLTIPKLVLDQHEQLLYASRAPIPSSKDPTRVAKSQFLKQVCVYGFSAQQLEKFSRRGTKTPLEESEDIEVLRFIELDQPVKMVKLENRGVAVDEPNDVNRAEVALRNRT